MHRALSRLMMDLQLKPLGEESLQQQKRVVSFDLAFHLRLDVVWLGIDPARSTRDCEVWHLIGIPNQSSQRGIAYCESSGIHAHAPLPAARVEFNRRHFYCGGPG